MASKPYRTNPTGIQIIDRSVLAITVRRNAAAAIESFSVDRLDLAHMELPGAALATIVAYSGFDEMRIDAGTVADLKLPKNVAMNGLDTGGLIFRAFVTEPSGFKLLASCEGIRAVEEDGIDRLSLLSVHYEDLGERMWDVKMSGGGWPMLRVNSNAELDLRRYFETYDPFVRGLIVPQAFQQVLVYLVLNPAPDTEPRKWQNVWSAFLEARSIEVPEAPQDVTELEDIQKWATNTAARFAHEVRFVTMAIEKKKASKVHA
jgi:hypothetical protein